jgi:serine/threonine protein kinase
MSDKNCPSPADLYELIAGRLTEAEIAALSEHLDYCRRCLDTVQGLKVSDTLLEAARESGAAAPPAGAGGSPEAAALEQLIGHVKALESLAAGEATESFRPAGDPGRPAAGRALEPYEFLSPAQRPDELGRLGVYRVINLLGEGGMGIVFQAEDTHLQRTVALKVMKPAPAKNDVSRERFLREARAAASVKSDHVVTIHQVGEDRGVVFLAMEFLEGMSLEDWLKKGRQATLPQMARIGRQIALGLSEAHASGLIHRDIKPANIWLESRRQGRVKLLDFGLARAAVDAQQLTQSGTIMGTPAYMAPEQARSENVDQRADLFSLGVVLYRLATGQLPFRGETTMSVLAALALEKPTPPREINPDLPPALADLIMQLLAKNPADRPASANAVVASLQAFEGEQKTDTPVDETARLVSAPRTKRASSSTRLRRLMMAAAVALLVLLPLAYFFGGTIIRVATNKGELVVEVDDDHVEVVVKQNGVELRDKTKDRKFVLTAGEGEVEFFDPDTGAKMATKKFTLTRSGMETVTARMAELAAKNPVVPEAGDADRRAAEWVLSIGGYVGISDIGRVRAAKDLPAGPFQLLEVTLESNQRLSADGLARLEKLKSLGSLWLQGSPIRDAWLVHLRSLNSLNTLNLHTTGLTDSGLQHLSGLTNLTTLNLANNSLTDGGLVHLKGLTNLTYLDLNQTRAGDAGLGYLTMMPKLGTLELGWTSVTDAGLGELKTLTNLTSLRLNNTQVSNAGLAHIKTLTKLKNVHLNHTKITATGVRDLVAALPNCEIACDLPAAQVAALRRLMPNEPMEPTALV